MSLTPYPNTPSDAIQPPEGTQNTKLRKTGVPDQDIINEMMPRQSPTERIGIEQLSQHMASIAEEVDRMPEPGPAKLSDLLSRNAESIDYRTVGELIRIDPSVVISQPPVCLSIQYNERTDAWGTLGNFSMIIGKAKSRKTFAISIAVAAALKQDLTLNRLLASFDEHKRNVLYFDTEQGHYHVWKVAKRICQMADQESPTNLFIYPLRSFTSAQCLGFIQWHLYNTPNIGLVVIDGIRDTINDINDNAESNQRAKDLLRWSAELDIHIITVLHMNKGDENARGTIGTELTNKAEMVISVALDEKDKNISIVSAKDARDRKFEPFAFAIDENQLPYLVDDLSFGESSSTRSKKPTADTMSAEDITAILKRTFLNEEALRYGQLLNNIVEASEFVGLPLAKSRAETFIPRVIKLGHLIKSKQPNQRYEIYRLSSKNSPLLSSP